MDRKDKLISIYTVALVPLALLSIGWALSMNPFARVDAGVVGLAGLTVFCSCFLRIQLPRFDVHLTISDALIILAMLIYGGDIALLLAVIETAAASINLRRRGLAIKTRTIAINTMVAAIAVFAASQAVAFIFGPTNIILERHDLTSTVWLLGVMTFCLFAVNSASATIFSSIRSGRSLIQVWKENCLEAAVIYVSSAIVAGLVLRALDQVNILFFVGVVGFFGVLYLAFRHFVNDVRKTTELAKRSERERAEQAEEHVKELEHYVDELERSSEALQESHENFRNAAFHDALTGLPNRNFFIDTLKVLLEQSRDNKGMNFAILLLDLNRFKTINDSLGHSIGDRLITNVGKRLSNMMREQDMVARLSGDKFGLILVDLTQKDEATGFAERIAKRIAEPYTLDGRQVFTNVKIGIAFGNSKYVEAEDILRDADIAMYSAKDQETPHVIFDQNMHTRAVTRLQLETDLRFALERDEFEVYYQPIIGLDDASLAGFEALVRWNHPQRGLVSPDEFIPMSESTGLIVPMTIKILHSACWQIEQWQKRSPQVKPLSIAVNLSGKHFAHPGLVDQIEEVIRVTGIPPSSLKLELTESAVMENAETAILMLKQIKETGVQISIDDFGTGYSSLSYLHKFPIDLLKVDQSFVGAMEENSENGEIVRTVIALAKALNLKVVAEGIESIHQYHQLRILGCEYGQGYLFSKPLKAADIERLLDDKTRWNNILPTNQPRLTAQNPNISHLRLAR